MRFWATYLLCFLAIALSAQTPEVIDSTKIDSAAIQPIQEKQSVVRKRNEDHSPKKAAMLSAIVPGLGQVYNRKYWKVPLVYGILGGVGYLAYNNTRYYKFWHDGLIIKNAISNGQKTSADFMYFATTHKYRNIATNLDADELYSLTEAQFQTANDDFRRNRDLSFFFLGLLYMCNILDATVDGHLYNFNVSDDLSLHVQPTYISSYSYFSAPSMGLSVMAKF